jgi:cytidylate kinase
MNQFLEKGIFKRIIRKLNKSENINQEIKQNIIITINREYGSGGRYVGGLLAEKLGIKIYDRENITGISNEENLLENDELFLQESNAIKEIASKESCIIIGKCADYILKDNENVLKIFLHSDDINKVARAVGYYGLEEKNAYREISKINKAREKNYNYHTGQSWKSLEYYDISINVDSFGIEQTVNMIENIVKNKVAMQN